MIATRRKFIANAALVPASLGMAGSLLSVVAEAPSGHSLPATAPNVGCITGNVASEFTAFEQWLGAAPPFCVLFFNQSDAAALASSIPYLCALGSEFIRLGANVIWSVPCPGRCQLEAIVAGNFDAMYKNLFRSILALYPNSNLPVYVRLPWEFNLSEQENAAMDKSGHWDPNLFITAWQRLAKIAHGISPRFMRIWCPNVTTQSLDPALCWPGTEYVEIVSQDFYMEEKYNKAGDSNWFLNEKRGLIWGKNFALANNKSFAMTEWGMDSDIFVNDFNVVSLWMQGLGGKLHHHCWWNRPEVINCVLTGGALPGLAKAYKQRFA